MAPRVVEKREQILQAVILAHDGDGAFRPLKAPAALVDVCGRPALEHALRFVARAGAGEVVIACAPDEATGIQEAVAAAPLSGRDGRPVAVTTLPLAGCESEGDFLRELDQRGAVASDPFILVRGDVVANVSGLDAVVAEHVRRKKKDDADATMTVCLAEAGPRARRLQPLAHDDLLVSLDAKNRVLGWYGGGNARDRAAADLGFVADETYGDAEGLALRSDLIDCHVDVCSLELLFRYSENFDYQASRGHFVPSEVGNAELGQRVYAHVLGATGGRGARVHDPRVLDAVARDVAGGWFAPLTPAAREVRPGVFVGAGVSAPRTAKVSAPAVLGRGSVLAEGAVVDQSFLGEGCRLGEGAVVRGSHVGRGCVVGAGATVDRCLLGAGVVVAPGAAAPRGCVLAEGVVVAKAASLPEFSRVSADSTDEALVGAGGVGCLWQGDDDGFDDDDDGDDAAAAAETALGALGNDAAAAARERRNSWPPGSDDEDEDDAADTWDFDGAEAAKAKASDDAFRQTVREMILAGSKSGAAVDSMIMEVNCYKLSENRTFRDAAPAALEAVMDLAFAPGATKAQAVRSLSSEISRWTPLLAKLLGAGDVDDERFAALALEALVPSEPDHPRAPLGTPDVFAIALQKLYEADVLSGDGILAWGEASSSALRKSAQVGQLLAFLEDDSDEDESGSEEESD